MFFAFPKLASAFIHCGVKKNVDKFVFFKTKSKPVVKSLNVI